MQPVNIKYDINMNGSAELVIEKNVITGGNVKIGTLVCLNVLLCIEPYAQMSYVVLYNMICCFHQMRQIVEAD